MCPWVAQPQGAGHRVPFCAFAAGLLAEGHRRYYRLAQAAQGPKPAPCAPSNAPTSPCRFGVKHKRLPAASASADYIHPAYFIHSLHLSSFGVFAIVRSTLNFFKTYHLTSSGKHTHLTASASAFFLVANGPCVLPNAGAFRI